MSSEVEELEIERQEKACGCTFQFDTPGETIVIEGDNIRSLPRGVFIAYCLLHAAAPAMLAALERLIWTLRRESIEGMETPVQDAIAEVIALRAADAAIASAKGED